MGSSAVLEMLRLRPIVFTKAVEIRLTLTTCSQMLIKNFPSGGGQSTINIITEKFNKVSASQLYISCHLSPMDKSRSPEWNFTREIITVFTPVLEIELSIQIPGIACESAGQLVLRQVSVLSSMAEYVNEFSVLLHN